MLIGECRNRLTVDRPSSRLVEQLPDASCNAARVVLPAATSDMRRRVSPRRPECEAQYDMATQQIRVNEAHSQIHATQLGGPSDGGRGQRHVQVTSPPA